MLLKGLVPKSLNNLLKVRFAKNMSSAYFRWKDEAAAFDFSFHLENKDLGVSRQFNFSRKITETVGDFRNRVCTNLEKTLNKKKKKKKQSDGSDESSQLDVHFAMNGEMLSTDAICKDAMYQGGVTMQLFGQEYHIHVNSPWVTLLSLSDSILAGFPTYPSKVELEFADKENCKFTWYRSEGTSNQVKKQKTNEDLTWVEVSQGYCYTPTCDDIGCYIKLRCVPQNPDGCMGPPFEVISSSTVQAGPGTSPFELRHTFTQDCLEGNNFRVITYNLLADLYADSDYSRTVLFPYCPPYALAIDYRKQLILKELIGYHGDIICLQEVDSKVFDLDLLPVLGSLGYRGLFSKKGGQVTEGLAFLYRESRFEMLSTQSIVLGEEIPTNALFKHLYEPIKENEALKTRLLERGTILQVVVLRHKEIEEVLVIGVTHLYFHPDADHVRLLQAATCLSFLQHTLQEWQQKVSSSKVSLMFCGDFNSTPEFGVYRLMTQKEIPSDYLDWSSNEQEAVKGLSLSHDIHLESACGTPKYTNFTAGFADCLDYIFYQTNRLEVKQVVPLPTDEELHQYTALPSVVLPSDHVALVADLAWTQK